MKQNCQAIFKTPHGVIARGYGYQETQKKIIELYHDLVDNFEPELVAKYHYDHTLNLHHTIKKLVYKHNTPIMVLDGDGKPLSLREVDETWCITQEGYQRALLRWKKYSRKKQALRADELGIARPTRKGYSSRYRNRGTNKCKMIDHTPTRREMACENLEISSKIENKIFRRRADVAGYTDLYDDYYGRHKKASRSWKQHRKTQYKNNKKGEAKASPSFYAQCHKIIQKNSFPKITALAQKRRNHEIFSQNIPQDKIMSQEEKTTQISQISSIITTLFSEKKCFMITFFTLSFFELINVNWNNFSIKNNQKDIIIFLIINILTATVASFFKKFVKMETIEKEQEETLKEKEINTNHVDYEDWTKFPEIQKEILKEYYKIHHASERFIWFFYWIGRYDFLSHKPCEYDIVQLIILKELKNPDNTSFESEKINLELLRRTCEKSYTTGYTNAMRESITQTINHPTFANRYKPQNYKDPEYSAHDLIDLKINPRQ